MPPGSSNFPRSTVRPRAAVTRPSVLVVDDDPMVRRVLVRVLRRNYEVTEAESGEGALELMKEKRFDAVLSDLNLDGMSGRDLLAHLRQHDAGHASRTIIMSGSGPVDPSDEVLFTARFIEKPATSVQIEEAIAELTGIARVAA